jgi:GT2 family glycosyltransferase
MFQNTLYENYEIIIVDNNSTDDTPQWLEKLAAEKEQVRIQLNTENRGFSGGNNDGMKMAKGDFLVLINNDTVVPKNWLTVQKEALEKNPEYGLIGPVTNCAGSLQQISFWEKVFSGWFFQSLRLDSPLEKLDHWAEGYMRGKSAQPVSTRKLAFFCVMFSRNTMEEIGVLDEKYTTGMFEDDDYSMRVIQSGKKIGYIRNMFIFHFGSVSFKKMASEKYQKMWDHNQARFEKKWGQWKAPVRFLTLAYISSIRLKIRAFFREK